MKKNADFRNALGQPDEYFRQSVIDTLNELNREAEKEKRLSARPVFRTVCACAAMLIIILGSVLGFRSNVWQALTASSPDSIRPTPEVFTQSDEPQVFETEDAVLTVREAVADKLGVYLTIDVKPKKENYLAVDMSVSPENNDLEAIGINPDFEGQTLRQWAKAHGYELLFINACLPSGVEIDHSNGIRIREDGSAVISICGKVLPDTEVYDVSWTAIPLDTTAKSGADLQNLPAEQETFPVRVSAETKTVKTVETDYITVTFRDAKVRGTVVSVPMIIRPKSGKALPLPMTVGIESSPEDIGKTPDYPDQTILQWAEVHGYEEILPVWIGSPENAHPTANAFLNAHPSAFFLQEDGSLAGTVTGIAVPGADLYEMTWDITPYDIKRISTISSASLADVLDFAKEKSGIFRVLITDKAGTPETNTAVEKPQVFETELATFTVREAVADDAGVYFTVDVKPKDEHVLAVHMDLPVEDIHIHAESIGKQSDFDNQTLPQWAKAHDYELMAVGFSLSPDDSESSPHSYTLENHHVNNDNSMVMYIIDKAQPDTQIYNLFWNMKIWSADKTGTSESDILTLREERGSFPVCVSMEKETTKTVESDLVTMVFHDAVSDGTGVFISTEIRAKNEKTLPLLWDTDFLGSPEILGKTPDYPDQNILQWAREHGYEDLMFIMLMYPTSDTRLNGFSNAFTLQDDGSLAGTIAGLSIPEATLYGLYWAVIPYDMNKAEKYMQETHGLPLDSENNEAGIVPIAVADETETPETVAVYQLTGTAGKNGQAPETTLSLFRTSRCDYLLFRSEDRQYFGYNAVSTKSDVYFGRHIPFITRTELQEEHAVSILVSWQFPDPLPDTLSIGLYNSHSTTELEPPELEFSRIR